MYHSSRESNGVHSSVANVGGSEKNNFNFQHHEQHLFDVPVSCLNFDSQNFLCQSSGDHSAPLVFGSGVDSFLSSHEDMFSETYSELYEHFTNEQNNILQGGAAAPDNRAEVVCATSGNSASSMVQTKKKGIKWTKDLHEQFVAAVNSLGGAQKARPKAVLQMMNSKSLTIFHVKSHLQKYRSTMCVKNGSKEGHEENHGRDMVTELQQKISVKELVQICLQIEESRQLQLEIGRGIQEQLELQRNLQMLIQEQKKQVNGANKANGSIKP